MLGFENQTLLREAGNGRYKTYEEGLQCSKDIKAAGYVESSALLNEGIQNVSITLCQVKLQFFPGVIFLFLK